jgi:hypothetical protein
LCNILKELSKYSAENNLFLFETSAKDGTNVEALFNSLSRRVSTPPANVFAVEEVTNRMSLIPQPETPPASPLLLNDPTPAVDRSSCTC